MRPTEWSSGAIRQNILPPTLKTTTPSHCTMRVAAGRPAQNLSICFGVILVTLHGARGPCDGRAMTDWRPDKLARRLPFLQARARIQAALRGWFAREGFVEVETPILQVSPGAEVHLQGFATDWESPDGEEEQVRWLHSSPEFAMKKLLAGGVPKLFQFARVFRNNEGSALHHPEFTMLEWYRAGAGYEQIMEDCAALLALTGARELTWEGKVCDPSATPERLTVAEAFDRYAGVDVLATAGDAQRLARLAKIVMHGGDSWD